jgi:hypothetical protein
MMADPCSCAGSVVRMAQEAVGRVIGVNEDGTVAVAVPGYLDHIETEVTFGGVGRDGDIKSAGDLRLPGKGNVTVCETPEEWKEAMGTEPPFSPSRAGERSTLGADDPDKTRCIIVSPDGECRCVDDVGHDGDCHYGGKRWPQPPVQPEPTQPGRDLPPIIGRLETATVDWDYLCDMYQRHDLERPLVGSRWESALRTLREHVEKYTSRAAASQVYLGLSRFNDCRSHYRRDDTGRWRLRNEADTGWEDEVGQG